MQKSASEGVGEVMQQEKQVQIAEESTNDVGDQKKRKRDEDVINLLCLPTETM